MFRYTTVLYSVHPLVTTELGPIVMLIFLNIFIFSTIRSSKLRYNKLMLLTRTISYNSSAKLFKIEIVIENT